MSSAQNKDKYRLYVSDYTLKLSLQLFNLQTTYNFNVNSLRQLFIIHIKFKLCRKQCTFFVSKCFSFFFIIYAVLKPTEMFHFSLQE